MRLTVSFSYFLLFHKISSLHHATNTIFSGMVSTLEIFLRANQVDNLITHGCWCTRLDPTNENNIHFGGSKPVDEIDSICYRWVQSRRCLSLEGGTCEHISKDVFEDLEYDFDYENLTNVTCNLNNLNDERDVCLQDVCNLDIHFTKLIKIQIQNSQSNSTQYPRVLESESVLCRSFGKLLSSNTNFNMKKWKYCHGKSPMLTVTSVVCQPGTFHETAHICSVCPVGTYQPLKGQNSCYSCPENTYQDQIGSVECKACDDGSNSAEGAETCNQCEKGSFKDN